MGAKSKRKGSGFERVVCKMLNKHFNINSWKRVPLSGGFDKKNFPGDVYTMDKRDTNSGRFGVYFSVECKFYKTWSLDNLINGNHCKIMDWWHQATTDAKVGKKRPLLVFKKNLSKIFFMIYDRDTQYLSGTPYGLLMYINGIDQVRIGMFENLLKHTEFIEDQERHQETLCTGRL